MADKGIHWLGISARVSAVVIGVPIALYAFASALAAAARLTLTKGWDA